MKHEGTVLTVPNHHIEMCGSPPNLVARPGSYTGYFENDYGEQAVFSYDRATHKGTLWMGDTGWDAPYEVLAGTVSELILGPEEQSWLELCWVVATRLEPAAQ